MSQENPSEIPLKIAIAQVSTYPKRIEDNARKIIETITQVRKQGVDLVIFPELAIPGYASMDLFRERGYLKRNTDALSEITENTRGIGVIVGFVSYDNNRLGPDGSPVRYNSAALIEDRQLIGVNSKTLIPSYDVFYESNYFQSAQSRRVYDFRGFKLGIEICEDTWSDHYPINVSRDLVRRGAEIIFNLSASPFYVDKAAVRAQVIRRRIKELHVPFIYANLVAGQDGYDGELVFDGQSMVFNRAGKLIAQGKLFEEDLLIVDTNDLSNGKPISAPKYKPMDQLHRAEVFGLREYCRRASFTKVVLGLSGGIDSALVAAIAADSLGPENVLAVSMPSKFSSDGTKSDAIKQAETLGINFLEIPIERAFESILGSLSPVFKGLGEDTTEENIQARIRGLILMALSNKFGYLVISTGNKTEMATGYSTLYGDMCGGLSILADIDKLDVFKLSRFINRKAGRERILKSIINRPPTAELKNNQTDEASFGIPYSRLSPLVHDIVVEGMEGEDLFKKYPREDVLRILEQIDSVEYKRRQAAPGIKVSTKTFGIGRKYPIA